MVIAWSITWKFGAFKENIMFSPQGGLKICKTNNGLSS
jgi:hypothetical protein